MSSPSGTVNFRALCVRYDVVAMVDPVGHRIPSARTRHADKPSAVRYGAQTFPRVGGSAQASGQNRPAILSKLVKSKGGGLDDRRQVSPRHPRTATAHCLRLEAV